MRIFSVVALLALASVAKADLKVEYGANSVGLFYRDGDRVYYEQCAKRGCAGAPKESIASVPYDHYVRGIQTFYDLNDPDFGGVRGGEALDRKIESVKSQLASTDIRLPEIQAATKYLKELVTMKEAAERAQRDLLQFLEAGTDSTLGQQFQAQRAQMAALAFYRIAYVASAKRLYRLAPSSTWQDRAGACTALGDAYSVVEDARSLSGESVQTIVRSVLMDGEAAVPVWTGASSEPGYNVVCGSSCGPHHHDYPSTFYSVAGYHDKERSAGLHGMSICKYTNGCSTGEESDNFVPRKVTVVSLGTGASSTEDVEAGENSPSGNSHAVLCARDFKMDDLLAPTGDQLVSLSLYDLDASLERIAKAAYANRATFLREVNKALQAVPLTRTDELAVAYHAVVARAFVLNALSPVLHDMDTPFMTQYVLPDYERAKTEWNRKLKLTGLGSIELLPEVYHLALVMLKGALDGVQPFLTTADRPVVEKLVPALGIALAGSPKGLPKLAEALAPAQETFARLAEGRRTGGFGKLLLDVSAYLKAKAD